VEQLICRNPDLSKLDEEMGGLYKAIESETAGVDGETGAVINPLGEEQATWLEQVRNKCATTSCLQRAYIERICAMKTNWKDAVPEPARAGSRFGLNKLSGDMECPIGNESSS
jgi:uncharacterized protein